VQYFYLKSTWLVVTALLWFLLPHYNILYFTFFLLFINNKLLI